MTPTQLQRIRRELGLTQQQLAAQLGVTQVAVARWENRTRKISEPVARLLQRILTEARGKANRKGRAR